MGCTEVRVRGNWRRCCDRADVRLGGRLPRACASVASLPTLISTSCVSWDAAIWRSETHGDGDRSWMDQRPARDFTEFGRSGRRYTRGKTLDVGKIHATLPVRDLPCRRLAGGSCSWTHQTEVDGRLADRSSIWRLAGAGWQMKFDQNEPTSAC